MSHIKSYVVVKGDNLTKIAKANNLDVKDLIAANKDIKNPNLILVGQEIKIPGTETETLHITTGEAAAAAIKRQQELKSQEILNGQMEVSRQMEAERRNAGQVSEVAQQHLEDKIEKVTEPMRDESYLKQQEAMQNASDLKNQKIQDAQLETARQVEAERKNAGQVSETANAQIVDNIEETKVSEAIHDDSYQKQQEAIAEANAKQMKIESILAQQKFENAGEEARQQSLDNASKLAENQSFHNKEQLDGLYAMLGGRDYSGKGKKHGECGRLARVQLELLGLAKPETSNSAGISYAKNLYFNRDTILEDGYAAIGRIRNEDPGKTFDELINTNFKAVAISFNSKGHYSGSGEFGHVIVVSGYNRLTNKVYVIDNYDAKWNKGTTPSEYDLKDFKEFYFGGGNSINYMTAIVPKTADIIASADENITGVDLISEDAEIYDANLVENEQMPIDETQKLEDQKIQDAQLAAAKQTEAERMNAGQVSEEAKAQLEAKINEEQAKLKEAAVTANVAASQASGVKIPGEIAQTGIIPNNTRYDHFLGKWTDNQRVVSEIWNSKGQTSDRGIATIDGRYLVAVSPKFGTVGDKLDVVLDDGQVIKCIMADAKGSDATSDWGHKFGNSVDVVEWESTVDREDINLEGWKGHKVTEIINNGRLES